MVRNNQNLSIALSPLNLSPNNYLAKRKNIEKKKEASKLPTAPKAPATSGENQQVDIKITD